MKLGVFKGTWGSNPVVRYFLQSWYKDTPMASMDEADAKLLRDELLELLPLPVQETTITETIPDDLPDWAIKAMADGQLFHVMCKKARELDALKALRHLDGR